MALTLLGRSRRCSCRASDRVARLVRLDCGRLLATAHERGLSAAARVVRLAAGKETHREVDRRFGMDMEKLYSWSFGMDKCWLSFFCKIVDETEEAVLRSPTFLYPIEPRLCFQGRPSSVTPSHPPRDT